MKHSNLVNAISAYLGNVTRVCTRYNHPIISEPDHDTQITYDLVSTKLVAAGYLEDTSYCSNFTLRTMELCNETVVATKEVAITKIAHSDELFQKFSFSRDTVLEVDLVEALKWAKLPPQHLHFLQELLKIIDGFAVKDRGPTLIGATRQFGNEAVALFVQLPESTLIIRFEA